MPARGPYGLNSTPTKLPKWKLKTEAAPKQVSRGTLSRPKPLPAWRPGTLPQDAVPHTVKR
jgi:hypothetical protein